MMYKIEYGELIGERTKPNGERNVREFHVTSVEFIQEDEFDAKMKSLTGVPQDKTVKWDGFLSSDKGTKTLYLDNDNNAYRVWKIDA